MSDRVSQMVLLCEDGEQERLTKAYLKTCGIKNVERVVRSFVASRLQFGGNIGWVLNEFPRQLHACRQRQKKANTLLIVVLDADRSTVADRRRELLDRLKTACLEEFGKTEPAVILIAKRHVETWIRSLLGESVTEEEDCKTRKNPTKEVIRRAAQTLHQWSRENSVPGPSCVASLKLALPEWRQIG